MSALPRWASRGLLAGLALSLPVSVAVVLVAAFPSLRFGYPLALLPLLAAGPIAVGGIRRPRRALLAAALAGLTSAVLAAGSLAVGSQYLGTSVWALTSASTTSPLPPLPRLSVLPLTALSWAQQDLLVLQPIAAILLGALTIYARGIRRLAPYPPGWIVPRSGRARLLMANGGMLLLILLVGWIGFSSLEQMHRQDHLLQVHAAWQRDLSEIEGLLGAEQVARASGRDESPHVFAVRRILARLADTSPRPDSAATADEIRQIQESYQPSLRMLTAAYAAHRVRPDDASASLSTRAALSTLRREVEGDVQDLAAADDLTYHQRLLALLLVIGLAGAAGLAVGQWTALAVDVPLRRAIAHALRVSRGNFSRRAPTGGTSELQRLAVALDSMAVGLKRLHAIETSGDAASEETVVRGQILARAAMALVGASEHEKIFQVAIKSAIALARHTAGVRATVAVGPVDRMTVVAADGAGASEVLGAWINLRRVIDGPNFELQQRRFNTLELGVPVVIGMLGIRPKLGTVIVTTLMIRHDNLTMILLESDEILGDECSEGLARLGADVVRALDSAVLNGTKIARRSEARFRSLVQNSTDVVMIVGQDGIIQYQSPSGERVFGYDEAALLGTDLRDLIHPNDVEKLHEFLIDVTGGSETTPRVEWRVHHADGSWIHTETVGNNLLNDPDVCGLVLNSRDIGDRRALQDQLAHQAFHDKLTRLPNRALFMDRLEHALLRTDRRENAVAMLFLDLDNFKVVNDSLGHQAGDQMLVEAADRLLKCVRTEDTVARLGGDEFTILIEDVNGLDHALQVAERIAFKLRSPFYVVGREVFSSASIGIAVSGPSIGSPADLLRNADLAMYRAKNEGKARHVVFDGMMNSQAMKRLELETALRRAVDRHELRLMYQPIMSLDSMGIDRVETLVRWQHPERGLVSPSDFIPLAEETGLIVQIGQWILGEACRQAQAWREEFPSAADLVVSVNLSPRQFLEPTLVEDIAMTVRHAGLNPKLLELEITEGAVMEDPDAARKTLQQIHDLGISLAIDDFGTGYSSLGYLKRFPVSVLKIDQSFVRGLGHDEQDSAIVRGVIALAQSLNLTVTAEGIETLEQLGQLRDLGCNHGQGYLLSRPLPPDALAKLLARSTTALPSPKHGVLLDRRAS